MEEIVYRSREEIAIAISDSKGYVETQDMIDTGCCETKNGGWALLKRLRDEGKLERVARGKYRSTKREV